MGLSYLKINNRGASLVMVIIGLAFVMALGTIAVSAAVMNSQMKRVDRKAKYNFYSAEAALDEIKIGLTEDVTKALSKSYQVILSKYSTQNEAMRKNLFLVTFIQEMKTVLGVTMGSDSVSLEKLNQYLKETKIVPPSTEGAQVIGSPVLDAVFSEEYITIKGVKLSYTLDGYCTLLTTDIKLHIPKRETCSYSMGYEDYTLIADEALNARFTNYNLTGNVYAGSGGINTGLGMELRITGSSIITKGDIMLKDLGELLIGGADTEVWADNLITTQSDKEADMTEDSVITIDAACYIRDDLALDAKRSKITLTGEYIGYSNGASAEQSSAIVVNASDAALDLSGLSKLSLAGRAHISLDDGSGVVNYTADDTYGAYEGANCDIQTGESLVLKGSQNVYLLPSEYILLGHNPVSWNEYTAYFDTATGTDTLVSIPTDAVAFTSPYLTAEECLLLYYLDSTEPVKKAFYKFGSNDNVVYYYLNFKSEKLATTYFKNYMRCYPDKVYNGFPVTSIKLNTTPGAYLSAGNLMLYDTDLALIRGTNGNFSNNHLTEFRNLTTTLNKNQRGSGNMAEDIVFENIVDLTGIRNDAIGHIDGIVLETEFMLGSESCYVCIVDNEAGSTYHYNLSGKKGIIITTGDVSIDRNFTGLILSNGSIDLNASTITASEETVKHLLSQVSQVSKYFKAYQSSGGTAIDPADLITYENWKKN